MSHRRPLDDLVTFPTPKEAFGRASQAQQHGHQQQQQQQQQQPKQRSQRKPPPGYGGGGMMSHNQPQQLQSQQTYPGQRPQYSGHQQQVPAVPQQQQQSQRMPQQPQRMPQQPQRMPQQQQQQHIPQQQYAPSPQQNRMPSQSHQYQQQQAPVPRPQQHQSMPMIQPQQQQQLTGASSLAPQFTDPMMSNNYQFQHQQSPPNEIRQPNPLEAQSTSEAERIEVRLRDLFNKVDRNRTGALTENELSMALFNTDKTQFQPSTVKLMIKLFDKDGSGTIDFREFYHLWNYISHWRTVFGIYDKDKSNTITFSEYQETLKSFGYRLPTDTVLFVFQKFSHSGGGIYLKFDSYVESLIWLLRCTNSFKKYDSQETGVAVFPFDKYIQEILGFQ
ncbi:Pef1 protein [Saccharomycopsis crataegensis]|uniref:Pef1 protein n=1 Tax=Saccharomycopsis crataegensis TaxID=43959 RepID=A0AAV5QDB6_9ASCO|nr:Pef1 protein [Saccharomycopsis crataegensis]